MLHRVMRGALARVAAARAAARTPHAARHARTLHALTPSRQVLVTHSASAPTQLCVRSDCAGGGHNSAHPNGCFGGGARVRRWRDGE